MTPEQAARSIGHIFRWWHHARVLPDASSHVSL